MVIKVYISGISGNKEVKKRQQRVMMILESKNISYEVIDITEPGKESDKEFMQQNSKPRGDQKHPLPPQIFNEEEYCGDFEGFDLANENDVLLPFLHMAVPIEETPVLSEPIDSNEDEPITDTQEPPPPEPKPRPAPRPRPVEPEPVDDNLQNGTGTPSTREPSPAKEPEPEESRDTEENRDEPGELRDGLTQEESGGTNQDENDVDVTNEENGNEELTKEKEETDEAGEDDKNEEVATSEGLSTADENATDQDAEE